MDGWIDGEREGRGGGEGIVLVLSVFLINGIVQKALPS